MNRTPLALLFALSLLSLGLVACDSATPVAPTDSVITLTANPLTISGTGTSNLTIEARKPNGQAVNPGTEIRLSTTLGRLSSEVVTTDDAGIARATLTGDGRFGEANVVARSGASASEAVMVTIGRLAGSVTLSATPQTVGEDGGSLTLSALVRDQTGQPVAGVPTNFRTEAGRLASNGAVRNTNDLGVVTDRLTVSDLDVAVSGDDFKVFVEASASDGAPKTAEATIAIARPPRANFTLVETGCSVSFTDSSQGRPTEWRWDFGDLSTEEDTSMSANPSYEYPGEGTYAVRLKIANAIAPFERLDNGELDACDTCEITKQVNLTASECSN